ncbi:MAG: hypothetical protein AAF682_03145 [Planctomycetota bacterium]
MHALSRPARFARSFLRLSAVAALGATSVFASDARLDTAGLRALHAGFDAFHADVGGRWWGYRGPGGGLELLYGNALAPASARISSIEEAAAAAERVLARHPELWGAPLAELHLARSARAGTLYAVHFEQQHRGLAVDGARASVYLAPSGAVAAVTALGVEVPPSLSTTPALSAGEALALVRDAQAPHDGDDFAVSELYLHVTRSAGRARPALAYRVSVHQPALARYEWHVIDAQSGATLAVDPAAAHGGQYSGNVSGVVNASTNPNATLVTAGLPNIEVRVGGAPAATTDANGDYTITATPPVDVDVTLKGPWFDVLNFGGADALPTAVPPFAFGFPEANLVFNLVPTEFETAQATAAYLHARIREYAQAEMSSFVPATDQEIHVNVDVSPATPANACNAYYIFDTAELRFERAHGVCVNTAYSSIFEHEYGHHVDDVFGGPNGKVRLREAIADVFCSFALDHPLIGEDISGPGKFLRTGNNNNTWPLIGTEHAKGTPFFGFAWTARKDLTAQQGTAGTEHAEDLFLGLFPAEPASLLAAFDLVFLMDDGEQPDLSDGSPNYPLLASIAVEKGFTPPETDVLSFVHAPHPETWNQTSALDVVFEAASTSAAALTSAEVEYEVEAGGALIASGTLAAQPYGEPGLWVASIPPPTVLPAIVRYRISIENADGYFRTEPGYQDAYLFAVGDRVGAPLFEDDMEGGANGWTTGGGGNDWERAVPPGVALTELEAPGGTGASTVWGNDITVDGNANGCNPLIPGCERFLRQTGIPLNQSGEIHLRYRRWLTAEDIDDARIEANGLVAWENDAQEDHIDREWVRHDVTLPPLPGVKLLTLEYFLDIAPQGIAAIDTTKAGGWTVDDVEVYALRQAPLLELDLTPSTTSPPLGGNLTLTLQGTPNAPWSLYLSTGKGPITSELGVLRLGFDVLLVAAGTLDAAGTAVFQGAVPSQPIWSGEDLNFQAIAGSPSFLGQISNPVEIVIQ